MAAKKRFDGTCGTDRIEALQLVTDLATQQINFVQPIDLRPPAAAVQLVQSMPATSHGYLSNIAHNFWKLKADGMGKFPDFKHRIMLSDDATHIAQPVRQVPIARCAAVEKEVKQMVTNDIWERVTMFSTLALNLVTVPKPDGRIQIMTDFSPLNNFVVPERHVLPHINDCTCSCKGPQCSAS
uniref:Uncharacterized protein n=1 Tax=Romanomermis culicivorax TaxID=13658 RepID=A0A915L7M5_ROMCU